MSLLNTVLPDFVLADLFTSSLIQLSAEVRYEERTKTLVGSTLIPYQGKNLHEITIGVYFTEQEQMPAETLDFLVNILKACQRNTEHVAIVNFATGEYKLEDIVSQLHPGIIMLFGSYPLFSSVTPETADFVLADLQGIKIIRVPALEKLTQTTPEARTMKGRLWMMLKQLFNL